MAYCIGGHDHLAENKYLTHSLIEELTNLEHKYA